MGKFKRILVKVNKGVVTDFRIASTMSLVGRNEFDLGVKFDSRVNGMLCGILLDYVTLGVTSLDLFNIEKDHIISALKDFEVKMVADSKRIKPNG